MSRRRAQSNSSNQSTDEEQGYISHRNSIDEGNHHSYSSTPSIPNSTSTSSSSSMQNNNNNVGIGSNSLLNSTSFRSNSFTGIGGNTHGSLGVIQEDGEDDNVVLNPVLANSSLPLPSTSTSTSMHSRPFDSHNSV